MPVTNYVWDPVDDNVVLETDNTNATTATYTHETGRYGGLISQRRGSTDSYFHYDGLGSTRELTNDSETVTDTNLYDAWGVNVDSSGSTENPYRWVGRSGYYYDTEKSDYYVRARVYQPTIGRWSSVDPLGFVDDWNLFFYSRNRPVLFLDPSGLKILNPDTFEPWIPPACPCSDPEGGSIYVPRGHFTTMELKPKSTEGDGGVYRIGSSFNMSWSSYEEDGRTNKFFTNYPGQPGYCCCCNQVGVVQIVHVQGWKEGKGRYHRFYHEKWHIDAGIPFTSKGPAVANPCPGPGLTTDLLYMEDAPNFPIQKAPDRFTQDFEACVVCLKPIGRMEGPVFKLKARDSYTIYGCWKWGHAFAQHEQVGAESPPFLNVTEGRRELRYNVVGRYIQTASGVHQMDENKRVDLASEKGIKPSKRFIDILETRTSWVEDLFGWLI